MHSKWHLDVLRLLRYRPSSGHFSRAWSCVRSFCARLPVRRWLRRCDASWMGWGGRASFNYVREYAIILYNLGRQAEAERVIDRELNNARADYGREQRDELLLLRAMIQGVDSALGRAALLELVRYGKSREMMSIALQLMARSRDSLAQAELSDFLNEMISRSTAHPLLGQMYYMRSELALARNDITLAEADARLLLEQFPGLQEIENVYRLFAYAAFSELHRNIVQPPIF